MNRIDQRIAEVTTLVDEGLQKHSLAHKSAIRIRELEEINREMLEALNTVMECFWEFHGITNRQRDAMVKVEAAIEKAREITWVRKGKL